MRIGSKHPVRNEIASIETYWDCRLLALEAIGRILSKHGMALQGNFNFSKKEGYLSAPIFPEVEEGLVCSHCGNVEELENSLVFSWYPMPSGRFEITCYLS